MACRPGDDLTAPAVMAKGGNRNPTVSSVVPASSKRGAILDVTVNGSGFDQGSTVAFEREGVPAAGITTNSTSFVNPRKLVANITIASTADTGKSDVAVTTSGGRNSLGLGLFTVEYELAELGIIGGIWSRAHAINDLQEVVGESCTGDCLSTAFYWSETGGMVDLGKLPGYSRSGAYGINNRGQVFGRVFCRPDDPGCGGESPSARVRWDRVGGSWTITPLRARMRPAKCGSLGTPRTRRRAPGPGPPLCGGFDGPCGPTASADGRWSLLNSWVAGRRKVGRSRCGPAPSTEPERWWASLGITS